jgi:predicted small lipoprotein YifL
MSSRLIALAVIASVALVGCGKRGTLERPPPLWGAKAKADYEAQKKADAEGRDAGDQRTGPERGNPITQPPESQNRTIAADPLDGLPTDPRAGSGQPGNMNPHP